MVLILSFPCLIIPSVPRKDKDALSVRSGDYKKKKKDLWLKYDLKFFNSAHCIVS